MEIVITGDYSGDYNRTNIILKGLQNLPGITVVEYPVKSKKKIDKNFFQKISSDASLIFLPAFTHNSVPFIRKLTKKPIIFDPLISRYLTKVFDYKLVWRYSPRALKNYLKDKRAFAASDIILADTQAHKNYYIQTFGISSDKIHVLPIGVNSDDFLFTEVKDSTSVKIGFYGGFIPLQGVKEIIKAAEILKGDSSIHFELIGIGFEYEEIIKIIRAKNLHNISLLGWIPYEKLSEYISRWDICLGIFGTTKKADLVIPNKIYHYAAMGKPIITKHTAAICEIFEDNINIALCSEKPEEIAKKILCLKSIFMERKNIGNDAHELISNNYNQDKIAEKFIKIVNSSI